MERNWQLSLRDLYSCAWIKVAGAMLNINYSLCLFFIFRILCNYRPICLHDNRYFWLEAFYARSIFYIIYMITVFILQPNVKFGEINSALELNQFLFSFKNLRRGGRCVLSLCAMEWFASPLKFYFFTWKLLCLTKAEIPLFLQ